MSYDDLRDPFTEPRRPRLWVLLLLGALTLGGIGYALWTMFRALFRA